MISATEFHVREPLPLHRIQESIFRFCVNRSDIAVFGAQAVNIHVATPRMTQDVDLLAEKPASVAAELAKALTDEFHAEIRVRELTAGVAYRVYQSRKEGPRHLADLRGATIDPAQTVVRDGIRYVDVPVLVAMKVCAYVRRRNAPKGATDLADLRRLLLAHPEVRDEAAGVEASIASAGGGDAARAAWKELLESPIVSDDDADEGY